MISARQTLKPVCVIAAVASLSVACGASSSGPDDRAVTVVARSEGKPGAPSHEPIRGMDLSPTAPSYPKEIRTSLDTAVSTADFSLVIPDAAIANSRILTDVFVWPDGQSVALDYPAPAQPSAPIRQNYIEVYESVWTAGDPLTDFKNDMAADPVEGKVILDIAGTPALGVEAHSPDAVDKINAAFLRFVIDGVEIQISGGESLDALIDVAQEMLATENG